MSRTQYLKTLERNLNSAAKIIDDLTRENYELRQLLMASATTQDEVKQPKTKEAAY